jgi:tetratricopeptide (TPR) repeat protein
LAARAHAAYPEEPQALHARGRALIALNRYDEARADFEAYERRLPGNPQTTFYLGRCFEGLGRRAEAIACYRRFLEAGGEGEAAEHARRRLREWGAFPS